ncbi:hypothetical protein WJ61_25220 [Burkholderia ubonensis]|uniref:Barstar (barnase inhibitor) domain-containing protein n=1 Tax=Burkholderia ubonensis TaxID=101571 RepID=A0AAW3MG04_9BURK|nr:hypothetical protein [Burkholderia ubonensis]KVM68089.1 hypothetical protein WJ61_25220 [Burkholderia ubonensis]KVP56197.1 hypothetical protein WJ91_17850 [Burkholderia ubonensis]KVP83382.1 hypothetical protein WJ96_26215 [Burkholderia ubonensis]KVX22241.1 hypothetical protein WL02_06230 [Burkholderia ubonensis]KVZ86941.1 hypothetical protein WL25_29885 [Burkholderia ubonensis]
MVDQILIDIDSEISKPGFFDFLSGLDADDTLDMRDAKPFDDLWMQAFNDVDGLAISVDDKKFLDSIREKAFKLSFRASGNSDIAGRVSDDVELIAKSMLAGKPDSWSVRALWDTYKRGAFPC